MLLSLTMVSLITRLPLFVLCCFSYVFAQNHDQNQALQTTTTLTVTYYKYIDKARSYMGKSNSDSWNFYCGVTIINDSSVKLSPSNISQVGTMAQRLPIDPTNMTDFYFEVEMTLDVNRLGNGYAIFIARNSSLVDNNCSITYFGVKSFPEAVTIRVNPEGRIISADIFPNKTVTNFVFPAIAHRNPAPYSLGAIESINVTWLADTIFQVTFLNGYLNVQVRYNYADGTYKYATLVENVSAPVLVDIIKAGDAVVAIAGANSVINDDKSTVQKVRFYTLSTTAPPPTTVQPPSTAAASTRPSVTDPMSFQSAGDDRKWNIFCGASFFETKNSNNQSQYFVQLVNGSVGNAGTMSTKALLQPNDLSFELIVQVVTNNLYLTNGIGADGYAIYIVNNSSLSDICTYKSGLGVKVADDTKGIAIRIQPSARLIYAVKFVNCTRNAVSNWPRQESGTDSYSFGKITPVISDHVMYQNVTTTIRFDNGSLTISLGLVAAGKPNGIESRYMVSHRQFPELLELIQGGNTAIAISGGFVDKANQGEEPIVASVKFKKVPSTPPPISTTTTTVKNPTIYLIEARSSLVYSGNITLSSGKVASNVAWGEELADSNSDTFKELAAHLSPSIAKIYSFCGSANATVIGFQSGGVCDYVLKCRSTVRLNETTFQKNVQQKLTNLQQISGSWTPYGDIQLLRFEIGQLNSGTTKKPIVTTVTTTEATTTTTTATTPLVATTPGIVETTIPSKYFVAETTCMLSYGGNITLPNGKVINADGGEWDQSLSDPHSDTFRDLADYMTPSILQLYIGYESVNITFTCFRQGSVISDYIVALRSLTSLTEEKIQEKATQMLNNLIKSGASGTGAAGLNWNTVANKVQSVKIVAQPILAAGATTKPNSKITSKAKKNQASGHNSGNLFLQMAFAVTCSFQFIGTIY